MMLITDALYIDHFDLLAVALTLVLFFALLLPIVRGEGPLGPTEWFRVRLTFLAGFPVILLASFLSGPGFVLPRLIFHVGAVAYPVLGLLLLVAIRRRGTERRWTRRAGYAFVACALSLPLLALYMTLVEPYWVETTETEVVTDQPGEEVRIVVLSDIQTMRFDEHEASILAKTNALEPDIILVPGDVLQLPYSDLPRELPGAKSFLRNLRAEGGVFVVDGDADWHFERYGEGIPHVTVLDNEVAEVVIRGRRVRIGGMELDRQTRRAAALVDELEQGADDLDILLAHRPMAAHTGARADSAIDLVVAGHTHGGQIAFPFFGPPVTLSDAPRHIGDGGLGELAGRSIYVSRGLGMERIDAPRVRLGVRPELALLRVR